MSNSRFLFVIIFTLFNPVVSTAQTPNYIFEHYDINDGLANNTVNDIFQDSKGFMWFSTENGASRFDGYEFVNYKNEPTNKNSLISSQVNSITEDKNDNLYFATMGGITILDESAQEITNYESVQDNILTLSSNYVWKVVIDNKNNAWVITFQGINLFEKEKEVFGTLLNIRIRGGNFFDAIIDSKNNLWLSCNYGVVKYNLNNGEVTPFDYKIKGNPWVKENMTGWNKKLFRDSKGNIWHATRAHGLYKIDPKSGKVTRYYNNPNYVYRLPNAITCVTEDKNGNIWIGTDGDGICILDPKTEKFQNLRFNPEYTSGLSSNKINSIYTDKSGNIWIGTFRGGIDVYYRNKFKFKSFKPIRNNENSLSHSQVLSIFEDKDKNIWIGTDGGGVNKHTLLMKEGNFIRIKAEEKNEALQSNIIKSIIQLDNGEIWFGTFLDGIQVYNPLKNKFSHLNPIREQFCNSIWSFSKDNNGNIWIGSLACGLYTYNEKKAKLINFEWGNNSQQNSRQISLVYTDSDNTLWIGTAGTGLYRLDKASKGFIQYEFDKNNPKSLSRNGVNSILMDSKKRLWVGTNGGGLNLLNEDKETFTLFTESDGLANNIVNDILEDDKGKLWISTGNGLSKFNPETSTFKNYDKSDGLQSNQFTFGAALKASDGRLYFGGVEGFSVFHPDSVKDNPVKPNVIFTDFLISNQPVKVGAKDSPLKKSISKTKELILNHKHSVITFKYTALNFINPHKNEYAYKLEGFDDKWRYVGNKREVTYTNLAPGNYTLKVIASNNDGLWNRVGTSINLKVLPPWWETWWFKTSMALIILLSISGFYMNRIRQIKLRNIKLELKVKERTKDLNTANTQLKERQEEILQQNEEILTQKNIVTKQKEAIIDSINYAQQIQKAVLPSDSHVSGLLNEHFILYLPKDIVSGDFYWIKRINNSTIVAAADCTGHGVPGAFMSMLGVSFLNEIVSKKNIDNPAEILNRLRKKVKKSLHQNDVDSNAKDGMDMSLYSINEATMELQFSGAFNSVYIIRNNNTKRELIELKADRQPVAIYLKESDFTNHQFKLQKGDCIYSFSDGYADQFGGETGNKLMTKNLKNLITQNCNKSMVEQKKFFQEFFYNWKGGREQIDDVLLIGLRVRNGNEAV